MSVLFWTIDPYLDAVLSGDESLFIDFLFSPEPVEIWIRSLFSCVLVLFGVYIHLLVRKKDITNASLIKKNNKLNIKARDLIDNTDTGYVVVNDQGVLLEANEPYLRLLGVKNFNEIKGRNVIDWTAPESQAIKRHASNKCAVEGNIKDFETTYLKVDGNRVHILINASTEKTSDGLILRALCKDITRLKNVEFKLRQKEAHFREAINVSPATTYILAAVESDANCPLCVSNSKCNLKLTFISDSIETVTGYSASTWLEDSSFWLTKVHKDDREKLISNYQNLFDGGLFSCQYRFIHKDGSCRWVSDKLKIRRCREGRVIEAIGSMIDITEIKQATQLLNKLGRAVEQSPNAIFITDTEGVIEYTNPKVSELTGYTEEEILGSTPKLFSSGEMPQALYCDLWGSIIAGNKWHGVIRNKKKDGELFWMQEAIAPVKNEQNEITGFVSIAEDITGTVETSQELELLVKERTGKIKELERERSKQEKAVAIGRMAAWVAHEVNNPLAGIKNSFQLIKTAIPENHQYYHYVNLIDIEINRIGLITKQLYSLYKQDGSERNQFDCITVVKEVISLCESSGKNRSIVVEDISEEDNCIVELPENLIRQVLFNLIQNAIDHSFENSKVFTKESIADNILIIRVENRGKGISEEDMQKIFDPFFTTKSSTKQTGLGLGLTITHSAVKTMKGELIIKNQDNKGGVLVEVRIPLLN